MNYNFTPEGRDPRLWELARRRASFRSHLTTYLIMSVFFWVLWYFTGGRTYNNGLPWPVWPMLGWGIGVAFHYIGAYVRSGSDATEREYEKLQQQQKQN
ncbi:MAG TPA: 2TM domain-containing protein [Chitinophagaceae bacterium]|jgi:hypothetical protein|nr:2TM domain-containing protein [Chitinophagaceae bacterium]